MSQVKHIADAEKTFYVKAVTPDFCKVGGKVVPFMPMRELKYQKDDFAKSVFARGEPVLMIKSIISGVKANAGRGVISGVAKKEGHVKVQQGSSTVFVEGRAVARHEDICEMNGQVDPVPARDEDIIEVKA